MEGNDSLDELFKNKLSDGNAAVPAGSWQSIAQKMAYEKQTKSKSFVLPFPFFWIAASFLAGSIAGLSSYYVYNLRKENDNLKKLVVQSESSRFWRDSQIENENGIEDNKGETVRYSFNLSGRLSDRLYHAHPILIPVHYRYKNYEAFSTPKSGRRTLNNFTQNKRIVNSRLAEENQDLLDKNQIIYSDNQPNEPGAFNTNPAHTATFLQKQGISDTVITKTDTIYLAEKNNEIEQEKKIKKAVRIMGFPISVGLYVTPEMASRTVNFSENTDPEIVKYKQKDERKFGFSAGLSLDLHLPKNFFIRTGISYWNVGEKNNVLLKHSDYDTTYTKDHSSTSNITVTKILTPINNGPVTVTPYPDTNSSISLNNGGNYILKNQSTVETSNTQIKESISQFSSTVSNNYHYVGIPLIVGMKLNNKKLSFGLFSGIITNVLVSSSQSIYYIYYNPEQPDKYSQAKRELARFSLVYTGGVDINYKIAKLWTVSLSPNIKYSLTSIYKNENSVKQLPYSFGLQFGVKYCLAR